MKGTRLLPPWPLWLAAALVLLGLSGPILAPADPLKVDLERRLEAPSHRFPLGTDALGRCVLSRTLHGGFLSLGFALGATLLSCILGIALGLASSLADRMLRPVLDWVIDVMLAFPFMILAVAIAGLLGPSALNTSLGLAAAGLAWWARFSRSLFMKAVETDFVRAAKAMGIRRPRLIRKYLFPQAMPSLAVAALLQTAGMVTAASGMSYLGFGAQPPVPEWGSMLREAQLYMADYPWMMIGPGVAVTASVGVFTAAGEALRRSFSLKPLTRW